MRLLKRLRTLGPAIYVAVPVILIATVIAIFSIAGLTNHEAVDALSRPVAKPNEKMSTEIKVTPSKIASVGFVRGDWIYLLDLSTGKEAKLVKGKWPALSPAGDALAYVSSGLQGSDPSQIKLLDLRTKQTRDFNTLANLRAFGPRWSNDGMRIAFEVINFGRH